MKTFAELYRECLTPPNAAQRAALGRSKAMPRPHWLAEPDVAWRAEADYVPTKLLPLRPWDPSRVAPYEVVFAWVVTSPKPLLALPAPTPALPAPAPALPAPVAQLELFA
jgi:hypothetical protein